MSHTITQEQKEPSKLTENFFEENTSIWIEDTCLIKQIAKDLSFEEAIINPSYYLGEFTEYIWSDDIFIDSPEKKRKEMQKYLKMIRTFTKYKLD